MQRVLTSLTHIQRWPKQARTLAAVSGTVLLTLLPHVLHVPLWIPGLIVAALAWRLWLEFHAAALPARWLRSLMALLVLLSVAASYRTLNGLEAGTALLAAMAGMKLIETRTTRDYTILIFIGFFLLFAELLYNQSIGMLPYLLICATLLVATLLRLHDGGADMTYANALKRSARMLLMALPLAVMMFLFFPRLPGQFWAIPPRDTATSGLSDVMSPGDVADLSLSDAVAFRAQFTGELPPPNQRYWRAIVLHEFDGRTWRRERVMLPKQSVTLTGSTLYEYRLLVEPNNQYWIPALDVPVQWSVRRSFMIGDLQIVTPEPITQLTAAEFTSGTQYRFGDTLPAMQQRIDTRLSGTANPRTRAFATQLRAQSSSDEDFIKQVLTMFNQQTFVYTLSPPLLGDNAVDDFLFTTKRGFCEHYASAFTVLMRAAGIPARVVTGYQGGELNDMNHYLIVRQSDAHAWSEVWLQDKGWVRIDPTAAVSPSRIERGIDSAVAAGESVPGRTLRQSAWLKRLRLSWDAVNTYWKERIVQFGAEDQRSLLRRLGIEDPDWRTLGLGLMVTVVLFFFGLMVYLTWRFRPKRRDPIVVAYVVLKRKLEQKQVASTPYEGPVDFLTRASKARPELAQALAEIRDLYISLRYGPQPDKQLLSRLRYLVDRLRV